MRLTVLGGQGAWPTPGHSCSGYLVEHDGFALLMDPGYGTLPLLMQRLDVHRLDAIVVTHGHPDHCADLNPLLRIRALSGDTSRPLQVHAPAGALDAVLGLDRMPAIDAAYDLIEVADGDQLTVGPLSLTLASLPHHVPNLGARISDGHGSLTYTGDCGPASAVVALAADTDVLLIDATLLEPAAGEDAGKLGDVRSAVRQGQEAQARRILLTHLWPGTPPRDALAMAAELQHPRVAVATPGRTELIDPPPVERRHNETGPRGKNER